MMKPIVLFYFLGIFASTSCFAEQPINCTLKIREHDDHGKLISKKIVNHTSTITSCSSCSFGDYYDDVLFADEYYRVKLTGTPSDTRIDVTSLSPKPECSDAQIKEVAKAKSDIPKKLQGALGTLAGTNKHGESISRDSKGIRYAYRGCKLRLEVECKRGDTSNPGASVNTGDKKFFNNSDSTLNKTNHTGTGSESSSAK